MKLDNIIKVKDIVGIIAAEGLDDNTSVYFQRGKTVIDIKIPIKGMGYNPIARCGKYTHAFCMQHWTENEECKSCELFGRRHINDLYKMVDGVRYKKCSRCGKYYPEELEFCKIGGGRTISYCRKCAQIRQREYRASKKKDL